MSSGRTASFLELEQLDSDAFVNAYPPWLPPGAPGIYGGVCIAQCLVAAQRTVPTGFAPRSMHCTFLVGALPEPAIRYRVERLSSEADTALRTVRAHQNDQCVFIASLSFLLVPERKKNLETRPADQTPRFAVASIDEQNVAGGGLSDECPFVCSPVELSRSENGRPGKTTTQQWIKTRDPMPPPARDYVHVAALAYMSDNYFLPTASRVLNIPWWNDPELHKAGQIATDSHTSTARIKVMVSLDHSIYFHDPVSPRADEWIRAEMETAWTGNGRALVLQRMFTPDGTLLATALQEASHGSPLPSEQRR